MDSLLSNLYVFVLATFLGFEVIRRVSPLLHTPLMSLTNAITAITVLGAILVFTEETHGWEDIVGGMALLAVAFNLSGGFVLTHRILKMFRE